MAQQSLFLQRMSGAQNTFFIANAFDSTWRAFLLNNDEKEVIQFVRKICGGFFGFKTDGVLFIEVRPGYDFSWRFYNSDGSRADMCGNASRCAAGFFYRFVEAKRQISFLTGAGEIRAQIISDNEVEVEMSPIGESRLMRARDTDGVWINTGVPHFVIKSEPDSSLAKSLRQVKDFGPEGANITFVYQIQRDSAKAITFERGVEEFTQACGTGAVAASVVTGKKRIVMPGGELLIGQAAIGNRPKLRGPIKFEFVISNWE